MLRASFVIYQSKTNSGSIPCRRNGELWTDTCCLSTVLSLNEDFEQKLAARTGAGAGVSAIDSNGRTIFVADEHRDDGKRFVVHADELLTAFLELESVTRACGKLS